MSGEILTTDGGPFPQRRHVNALGMRFMIDHYDNLARWAAWALEAIETWDDTTTPSTTWRDTADAIFAAASTPPRERR
jgi:hypothetical protein